MKKRKCFVWAVLVFVILALLLVKFCFHDNNEENFINRSSVQPSVEIPQPQSEQNEIILDSECSDFIREGLYYGKVPENIRPVLLVDGTRYYWAGGVYLRDGIPTPNWRAGIWVGKSYFPREQNYTEYGSIKTVGREEPIEDGQMKAAFSASGTIYTSELTPEVVYVRMTSEWTGEDRYIRFVSEKLDNGYCIQWNGKYYRIHPDECEEISQIPENCERIGTACFVGIDMMPKNDLETNCPGDGHDTLEGREIFFDAEEPEFIYYEKHTKDSVKERVYVYKCPLWEE